MNIPLLSSLPIPMQTALLLVRKYVADESGADALLDWMAGPVPDAGRMARVPQPALEAWPVSRRIRSREVDDYTLLEPASPDADMHEDASGDEDLDED